MKKKKADRGGKIESSTKDFELALAKTKGEPIILRLYVSGMTPNSQRAIENVKKICEEYLNGSYELEVIDIYQQPKFAKEAQIAAVPTLVKELPLPLRKFIGDMSNTERIIVGLDVRKKT